MNLNIEHNLTDDQLFKAIVALAKSASLEERVVTSLEKALPGQGPRVPADPLVMETCERFAGLYEDAVAGIMADIDAIVAGKRSALDLFKAKAAKAVPEGPLTKEQIRAIQQAIRDRFNFIASSMEGDFNPDEVALKRWKKLGLVADNVSSADFVASIPATGRLVRNAFIFGRFHLAIEHGGKSYNEILKLALSLPLTKPDHHAVAIAEQQAASYITQFGEHLATDAANVALKRNRKLVHDMAVKFHEHRLGATRLNEEAPERTVDTWQGLKSELYHTMDDRARDWDRIAYCETYDAKRQGEALALLDKYGAGQLVYKSPLTSACAQCKHLYLTAANTPKLYLLKDMLALGNNVGRKPLPTKAGQVVATERPDGAEGYQAVAGLVHPWCECGGPFPATGMEWWFETSAEEFRSRGHGD